MDSEDGQIFVKNLASFVHTHERALANALHLQSQRSKKGTQSTVATAANGRSTSTTSSRSYLPFASSAHTLQSAKLALTPHHLFYLLSKFEDLGVDIGPMNVRLENLQHDSAHSNYVSFLGKAPKSKGKQADTESLRSVSSMRSVVSSMSSLWSNLTLSNTTAKAEKRATQYREDIRYLYSCFTKLPALKLSPDYRARLVAGYEEFPFDTAVPLFAFKNVSALEICDLDFRSFHGWDRLAEQLRSLTVKRGNVDDPIDLLLYIVLDDTEKRRRRSFKTSIPTTPSTPGAPWSHPSPKGRQVELARTISAPSPSISDPRRSSAYGSPYGGLQLRGDTLDNKTPPPLVRNASPPRVGSSRRGSLTKPVRTGSTQNRRSSGSSTSSAQDATPRHSSTDLVLLNVLSPSKWCLLRHLSLAENSLTFLTIPSLAPVADTLQSLDLSGNLFSEVPDALASLTHLRALNLSNCMIDSLKSLARSPLPAITTLNLRSNRLLSLAGIERLFSLERLDLRDNKLHDPTELSRLTSMPEMYDLFVLKNPFARTHGNYRVTIFNLFRATPGHVQDITIDTLPPSSSEKKFLVDRAPEPASVPVIQPPLDDELPPDGEQGKMMLAGAATEAELRDLAESPSFTSGRRSHGHQRSSSDLGPHGTHKKKRAPRRRIVELAQAEFSSPPSAAQPPRPVPVDARPRTPSESDQPTTPSDTPYHTAPSTKVLDVSTVGQRPLLGEPFSSPTPAPKIRDSSDEGDGGSTLLEDSSAAESLVHSDLYRQKIVSMKQELGTNWLSALNREGSEYEPRRERSFSPVSRSSTVRPEERAHLGPGSVTVGGRTLGGG